MALPLDLRGFGVTSGIRETAGERYMLMDIRVASSITMNSVRLRPFAAAGSISIKTTERIVPTSINGVRFPRLLFTRSDHAPNTGSSIRAKILSRAIIPPDRVSPMPKKYLSMRGIMLSYICQNALMARKANPTKTVFLLSSFIFDSPM